MNKTNIKGLQMSKLDIEQQETISFKATQILQDMPNIHDASLNQVDEELLQAWLEVFKEDSVKVIEVRC